MYKQVYNWILSMIGSPSHRVISKAYHPVRRRAAFNANLQEFAQKVSFIVALETGGKLSALAAYDQIEALRETLHKSKKQLGINHSN
jgi:hypothetical protein